MFFSAEIPLDVAFNTAQDKLADLVRGGLLGRASGSAFDQWQAGLAHAGPRASMLGMYKIARVRVTGMMTHGDSAQWAMRWEVAGRGDALVPALDADVKLTPAGPDAAVLTVAGVSRPPLANLAAGLDSTATLRAATTAIQAFTSQIAAAIADPAPVPEAGHTPEPAHDAGQRDRRAS
jgi:hypothetical protein